MGSQGKGRRLSPFPCTHLWRSLRLRNRFARTVEDRFSDDPGFRQKNFASGTLRNDDSHLDRPIASPFSRSSPCLTAISTKVGQQYLPRCFLLCRSTGRFSPRMIRRRHPFASHHRKPTTLALAFPRTLWCARSRDFLPAQRLPAILDGHAPLPPFTDQHLASGRRLMTALRLQLEIAIRVAHYPVLADHPLTFQPENPIHLRSPRRPSVIVFRPGCRTGEPPVVFRQIFPLQIHIRCFVTADLLPPQFLHQAVLVRAMYPLDSSLGLRRTRRDQLDPQLPAHAPKLRNRLFSPQLFPRRGRPLIQILPVHIQRPRNAVLLDPRAQGIRHRPDRLLLTQLGERRIRGIVGHVDQAAFWAPPLQPVVKAAVHLHQLPKVFFALPPSPVLPPLPLSAPQSFCQHPSTHVSQHRFSIHP